MSVFDLGNRLMFAGRDPTGNAQNGLKVLLGLWSVRVYKVSLELRYITLLSLRPWPPLKLCLARSHQSQPFFRLSPPGFNSRVHSLFSCFLVLPLLSFSVLGTWC